MKKVNLKSKSGITLVALVITIIILIILAGISISMVLEKNGILPKATDAKIKSDEAQIREKIQLAYHSALTKDITGESDNLTMPTLQEELNNEFTGKTVKITPSSNNKEWTIKVDNVEETVPAGKDTNPQVATLPSAEGTKPYFPKTDGTWHQVDGTTLTNGLVITDEIDEEGNSTGNEYVWIEVPRTVTTYGSSFNLNYDFDNMTDEQKNTAYIAIATALRSYVSDIIEETDGTEETKDYKTTTSGWKDEWYSGCGISSSTEYDNLFHQMLISIYKNGGFWIGRYEAGTTVARSKKTETINDLLPMSKKNTYPINYVTCSNAQTIATRVQNRGNYNSSLMFGIQWDLILKHLNNKGVSEILLTGDSSEWGNYYNQPFEINRGEYSQASPWNTYIPYTSGTANKVTVEGNISTKIGTTSANKILLTAGASDTNSKKNIYDLAGNIYEWTLEQAYLFSSAPCIRGGYYFDTGLNTPASYRSWCTSTGVAGSHIRFSCLYFLN